MLIWKTHKEWNNNNIVESMEDFRSVHVLNKSFKNLLFKKKF